MFLARLCWETIPIWGQNTAAAASAPGAAPGCSCPSWVPAGRGDELSKTPALNPEPGLQHRSSPQKRGELAASRGDVIVPVAQRLTPGEAGFGTCCPSIPPPVSPAGDREVSRKRPSVSEVSKASKRSQVCVEGWRERSSFALNSFKLSPISAQASWRAEKAGVKRQAQPGLCSPSLLSRRCAPLLWLSPGSRAPGISAFIPSPALAPEGAGGSRERRSPRRRCLKTQRGLQGFGSGSRAGSVRESAQGRGQFGCPPPSRAQDRTGTVGDE